MRLFFCIVLLFGSIPVLANIAYPYPVVVETPTGNITIFLKGNENNKYAITEDGYTVLQDEDGWYYAKSDENGNVVKSSFLASPLIGRSETVTSFLQKQKKGLIPVPLETSPEKSKVNTRSGSHSPVVGDRKVLIVLVEFPDCPLTKTVNSFSDLFNKTGYNDDGAKGSVVDFYNYVSYGKLNLQCDILGPVKAKQQMSYYGKNSMTGGKDVNVYSLFEEIVDYLDSKVSFADYDLDNDGYVDNIHFIYAGYGEDAGASSNTIWAHESQFQPIQVQGLLIDHYSCGAELRSNKGTGICRIGPHCHEIGHALGAMDYYDTDYATDGNYLGTGNWDVMASGSWNEEGACPANFNPYVKAYDFGWCNVETITSDGVFSILPSSVSDIVYRIDTPKDGDYFLIENRQQDEFDYSVPGEGMLIFHIDSDIDNKAITDKINSSYPQCCTIICASSSYRLPTSVAASYGNINSDGCPFPGTSNKNTFSINSTPAALCNDGTNAGFSIKDISDNRGIIDFVISFSDDVPAIGPTEREEIAWSENFDSNSSLDSNWSIVNYEGNGTWELISLSQQFSRNHYLQLVATSSVFDRGRRSVSMIKTPSIQLLEDDYILCLRAQKKGNTYAGINSITISIYDDESLVGEAEISPVPDKWTEYSVQINNRISGYYYIGIKGVCYTGTSLSVDDFVLRKKNIRDTNIMPLKDDETPSFMYSIWGTKEPLSIDKQGLFLLPNKKKVFIRN